MRTVKTPGIPVQSKERRPHPAWFEAAPMPDPREILTGLETYSGPWDQAAVLHLLRRTQFGPTTSDVKALLKMSFEEAVQHILVPHTIAPAPVNNYSVAIEEPDPEVPFGKTWINAPFYLETEYWRGVSLKCWWIDSMLQPRQGIHEKMWLFWSNHLAIQFEALFNARYCYRYLTTLHQHSLGNFKAMVKAITTDPAMLIYLNGALNEASAPDENYARELQELFCLGLGSGFTEADVRAAARVLTGWRVDWDFPKSAFDPWVHDTEDKQFSAFYDNALIKGRTGIDGKQELDDLLELLFSRDACAAFICRKLYRFFVFHDIDEATETNVIQPLAQIFRENNYDILPVLKALFSSAHFFDPLNRATVIKGPMDYVLGLNRQCKVVFPEKTDLTNRFQAQMNMWYWMVDMLQDAGDPPNVAGWPAYYQFPQYDKLWITASTLPKRAEHTDNMIYYGYPSNDYLTALDVVAMVKTLNQPSDPDLLIDELLTLFFPLPMPETLRPVLKDFLLTGQQSDYYWTQAWNAYLQAPNDEMARNTVESRLQNLFRFLLQLEEYQLM